jgi:hypothetical protein
MIDDDEKAWRLLCAHWDALPPPQPSGTKQEKTNRVAEEDAGCTRYPAAPLTRPEKQIRLLQLLPKHDSQTIACQLHTFDLIPESVSGIPQREDSSYPPYANFSYTWGESPGTRTILLNGEPFEVGVNCHEALQQVSRLSSHGGYFWMDSVCINQCDLRERAGQVTIMGEIYRQARVVLVCLGPHADDSDFLFRSLSALDYAGYSGRSSKYVGPRIRQQFLRRTNDAQAPQRLMKALDHLGDRPYWKRLWIIQEITLAQNVLFLCGDTQIGLRRFIKLLHYLRDYRTPRSSANRINLSRHMANTLQQALPCSRTAAPETETSTAQTPLSTALQTFGNSLCHDVRDRIYGLDALIAWPPHLPRLRPDYTISRVDLARRLLPYLHDHNARSALSPIQALRVLLKALELSPAHALALSRQASAANLIAATDRLVLPGRACQLRPSAAHLPGLATAMIPNASVKSLNAHWIDSFATTAAGEGDGDGAPSAPPLVPLRVRGRVAGVAGPEARAGDFLVKAYPFWLILRPPASPGAVLEIVGQAWIGATQLRGGHPERVVVQAAGGGDEDEEVVGMDVYMTFEDFVVGYAWCRRAGVRRTEGSWEEFVCQREYLHVKLAGGEEGEEKRSFARWAGG